MKITHCMFTMKTGGAQMLLVDLLNGFSTNHLTSLIIVNNEYDLNILKLLNKNVKVYFINRPMGSKNPFYLLKLNYLLLKIGSDIIHTHETNMVNFIYYLNAKLLLTVHDVSHEIKSISRFDSIISISGAVSNDVFKRYKITSKIIANGVDMHLFVKKENYTISDNKKFKIVQISRLIHEKKGQDILINSIIDVEKNNLNFQLQIDFIGDGPSELYLKELVKKNKLKSEINFLGNKNKNWIIQNLSDYHLLIQPSIYEGFGLTILEGFSANIPVIASNIDGPAEILKGLNFNFLFTVNNPERCASKIISIIKLYDQNLIKELVDDSYKSLFKKYDIKNTIDGYEDCYKRLFK